MRRGHPILLFRTPLNAGRALCLFFLYVLSFLNLLYLLSRGLLVEPLHALRVSVAGAQTLC